MDHRSPLKAAASLGLATGLLLVATTAQGVVISPAGGSSATATGIDTSRGCVYAGFDYSPSSGTTAAGPLCYTTPDQSTIPRLAPLNPARTAADLATVEASSPLDPDGYLAAGTFATRDVRGAPRATNSADIAAFVKDLPARYLPATYSSWLRTSINAGGGVGGHDNIPIYSVDSSNPTQALATFSTTDPRVTTFEKLLQITSGQVPLPTWAKPSDGGDHALAVFDRGTGILRAYFGVTRTSPTSLTYANAGYLYTDGSTATADNYWLGYIQGGSSVVGLANELTQIGAEEVSRGAINHAISVTFPSARSGVISFPAKASDGKLAEAAAPAEGQMFTLPANLDVDALGLSPLSTMIAKAAQKHGGIVSDQNYWTMAFNLESPLGMGQNAPNPWATGGLAYAALGGNLNVNDFPWALTEWLPVGYAGKGVAPTPTTTPTPTPTVTAPADTVAPTSSVATLPAATLAAQLPLTWAGTDNTGGSGVATYDVRHRSATPTSGFGDFVHPTSLQQSTSTSTTLAATPGSHYCVSVRARDTAGNVGPWSSEQCTVVGLDDRSLARGGKWASGTDAASMYGTWTSTKAKGATLTLPAASARQIGIVAKTCSRCGAVDVHLGGTLVGRVSLVSPTTLAQQVRWLPSFDGTLTGRLTITSTSRNQVTVDGLLVGH